MNRPLTLLVASALMVNLGCGPGEQNAENHDPVSNHGEEKVDESSSSLATCLLEGGELYIASQRDFGSLGFTEVALNRDGSILTGNQQGSVNFLFQGLDMETLEVREGVFHNLLLYPTGDESTSLKFNADGSIAISGDAAGKLGVVELFNESGGLDLFWDYVSVDLSPIQAVAGSADGLSVGWLDGSYTGSPRLWEFDRDVEPPAPLETSLWNGNAMEWLNEGSLFMIAGDWYGVPLVEIRLTADPTKIVDSWMLQLGDFEFNGGTITSISSTPSEESLLIVGHEAMDALGFIGLLDLKGIEKSTEIDDFRDSGLPASHMNLLVDHRPDRAFVLAGGEAGITQGEAGDIFAWDLSDLSPLSRADFPGLLSTAIDQDRRVLIGGTQDGKVVSFDCRLD